MTNDREIIATLRDKAKEHKCLSEIYSKAADQLQEELGISISGKDGLSPTKKDVQTMIRTKNSNYTFGEAIIKAFESMRPYTGKQLLEEYSNITGKQLIYGAFSGQLSNLKNKSGSIKMHEIKENPIRNRYLYGLSEWFDGKKLKKEYLEKFK